MTFTDEEILIEPGYCARTWQSCNYSAKGISLFHHRTGMRTAPKSSLGSLASAFWLTGGSDWESCWTDICGPRAEIEILALKWGGEAWEQFYAPDGADAYFLSFNDTEKALAFCRSEDFDRNALSMEKVK